ncbi:transcriptional regulator [Vibrio campbellii]|uniref:LysR substrate-binding domain-containing protein n=1 Tax=Vibrio campbellii TaxID=680 RepID=A0ACC7RDX5_9VIBR|nr:LysR substrate-binding domain-containing protein [Vibrio campbellii]APX06860.1 transcriptional regulator [Vibrio campbellii]ARR07068.1 transcriptional regulator [Vibrio campbellii]KGR33229.1 transcriptional regulator [Vibrio campbellii]OPH55547.1 transcriptional regulator [Vibrio campbellii]HDM8206488.1 LysR family transcriptional regulator [Vibrio campbellii]
MANQQLLLRNLHTFSIAAKHLSFTQAAKELHLTQGAVSHRIKVLEQELGFSLFVRGTRKLELTSEGHRFQKTLSTSLSTIFNEIEEIKSTDLVGELNIAASPGFLNGWLMPRIADFQRHFPGFNLNLFAQENQLDLVTNQIDVAIFYDTDHLVDVYRQRLFGEKYIPVCTPQYMKELNILEDGMKSLRRINFIHALGSDVWQRWVTYMELDIDIFQHFYCVSHRDMAVLAARNHVGVAMGRYRFVKDFLDKGELVSPYPMMDTLLGYDLVCPSGYEHRPKVKTFISWIESQLS